LRDIKKTNLKKYGGVDETLLRENFSSDESRYVSGRNLVVDGGVTTSRNLIGL
jgi:hypothetical protein